MFRNFSMFTKYPYTAGVIACVWIGTAIFAAIDPRLPLVEMSIANVIATTLFAAIGFRGTK